jgi:hypothetical protein
MAILRVVKNETVSLDEQIKTYKLLKNQIAALEKEAEGLKKQMIDAYFYCNEEYVSKDGLFKATYSSHEQEFFKTKDLKESNPKIYAKFVEVKSISRFLVR